MKKICFQVDEKEAKTLKVLRSLDKTKTDKKIEYAIKRVLQQLSKELNVEVRVHGKCKRCGSELLKRSSKRGEFLGCSSYPKCDYTEKLQ